MCELEINCMQFMNTWPWPRYPLSLVFCRTQLEEGAGWLRRRRTLGEVSRAQPSEMRCTPSAFGHLSTTVNAFPQKMPHPQSHHLSFFAPSSSSV